MSTSEQSPKSTIPATLYVKLATCGALILGLYYSSLIEMLNIWLVDPNYSHGFLVPVFSLVFAARLGLPDKLESPSTGQMLGGLIAAGSGIFGHYVAWMAGHSFFDVLALILLLLGLLTTAGGLSLACRFSFPCIFLIFMAPLPGEWYQPFAVFMQLTTAKLSCFLLDALGVPSYIEGYIIHLPSYSMEVGAACSGLRQLTAIIALAAGLGHWINRGLLFSIVLLPSSMVIAVLANAFRVVLTGLIMVFFGNEWAEGVFHTMEGVLVQGIAMIATLVFARFLCQLEDRWKRRETSQAAEPSTA